MTETAPSKQDRREVGIVDKDFSHHAVARRLLGRYAVCGAGRILITLSGSFDPTDRVACPACIEAES